MAKAFNREIRRSIAQSLGRFIAIAVIAALGAGFYAGLRMTAPDMKLAADQYFDDTNLCDIRVLSTLGLSDQNIEMLRGVEGVEAVMPAYEADAVAEIDGSQYTLRIHSLDVDAAKESDTSSGDAAVSSDSAYINRPVLVEGEWPDEPGECVIGADVVMDTDVALGETVSLTEETQDLDDVLDTTRFTVVGFVRSSYYASPTNLGSTSLGSGSVDQFAYIMPDDFADDLPYTEAFVTVEGARGEFASSDAYDQLVGQVCERIETLAPQIGEVRLQQLKTDAQETLDEERADFEDQRADAESQLEDARAQLADAKAQLDEAASTIAQSQQDLAAGQSAYDQGVAGLAEQRATAMALLDEAQQDLDDGRTQYEAAVAQLDELQGQLDQVQAGIAAIDAEVPDISAALQQANEGLGKVQGALEQLEQMGMTESPQYANLVAQRAELEASIKVLEDLRDTREDLVRKAVLLEAGISQITDGIAGLSPEYFATAQAQLDAERANAEQLFAAGQNELDQAAAQLVQGRAQLAEGQSDYASGLAEYEDGLAEYERQHAEAQDSFAEAEEALADAQQQIDDLEAPDVYVLDRTKLIGAESFESDANRIDQIAQVFPFIFFLVAALVSLTTMTRMVDEERVLIGTHKALGYSKRRIASKYLIYALAASGVGALAGIVALTQFLPYFIMNAYSIVYAIPPRPTPIDLPLAGLSAGLAVGITLAATGFACASSLRETPAALMQPRAPKAGKRILLERVGPVWRRLSFSWKVTARNIFRYKQRFFMAIVGIAGCTALLLTGLGLQNAINDIIDKQFYQLYNYSMTVRVDAGEEDAAEGDAENCTEDAESTEGSEGLVVAETAEEAESTGRFGVVANVDEILSTSQSVDEWLWLHTANVLAQGVDGAEMRVELVVPQDPAAMTDYFVLRERIGGAGLSLTDGGAIVSEKLATRLGLQEGSTVAVYREDDIGNAVGDPVEVPVVGIAENYVGHYLFVSPGVYEQQFGQQSADDTVYAKTTSDVAERAVLSENLLALGDVNTVGYNDEQIESYRTMLTSVDSVVVVLVVAAAALAFVVIYNLTNINIAERAREIATLKVLGFTRSEVCAYIFRETIILSIIGAAVGLVLGIFLEAFVVQTAEVDQVMFGREVHAASFVIAFVLTMLFTVLVMLAMRHKLQRIDMVESLKSNE